MTAAINQLQSPTSPTAGLSEDEKKKLVEEEGKQLEKLKASASTEFNPATSSVCLPSSPTLLAVRGCQLCLGGNYIIVSLGVV